MARGRQSKRRKITPEDLLDFTSVMDPQIAPDGSDVVFTHRVVGEKNEYVDNLWMVPADGADEPRPFTNGGRDGHPRWSPDGDRIAFISRREKTRPQIALISADGGEATALTKLPEGNILTFVWSPDGTMIAALFREQDPDWTEAAKAEREKKGLSDPPRVLDHWWYRLDGDGYFNGRRHRLYLIDVETGEHRRVYGQDTLGYFSFDFSPDSKQIVIGTNRSKHAGLRPWNDELLRLNVRTGRLTPIRGLPDGVKDAVRWSPDGKFIAYAGREGIDPSYSTENLEIWVCDPVKGKARSLTGREDYCLLSPPMSDTAEIVFAPRFEWGPGGKRIYAQIGHHGELHLTSIARRGGTCTFHTRGARAHSIGNISRNGTVALTIGDTTTLDEVYVADLRAGDIEPRRVTNFNGALLKSLELSKPKAQWVRSADGNKVHVWVMSPPGSAKKRRGPAVLEIHGGPHAQYGVGFFHEFQVLAARGYTVFFSNPRGSKGYGRDHCAAIRGDWGNNDWTDVQAVIELMKSHPAVNADRMGCMGGSYGGYMTNWVIGHCHDFAAAITDRCVSNLVSMSGSSDFLDPPDQYWPGNAWDRPERRWEMSPLKYLGKARTPTLIIHSEGDLRCNVEQAEQVFSALTLLKVPTKFVRYPRSTSHGMSRCGLPDMRLHRLHQIIDWWAKYL